MSESTSERLEIKLKECLGDAVPVHVAENINAALALSKIIEAQGFLFQLKDLCPKSMNETLWRAVFSKDGNQFSAEHPQSSMAVCIAAVGALTNQ